MRRKREPRAASGWPWGEKDQWIGETCGQQFSQKKNFRGCNKSKIWCNLIKRVLTVPYLALINGHGKVRIYSFSLHFSKNTKKW